MGAIHYDVQVGGRGFERLIGDDTIKWTGSSIEYESISEPVHFLCHRLQGNGVTEI